MHFPVYYANKEKRRNKNHALRLRSENSEKLGHLVRNVEQVTKVLVPGLANFPGLLS